MKEILKYSIDRHAAHLDRGEYSARELTEACLEQIAACEDTVGAFLTLDADGALQAAKESDRRRHEGACLGALDGIPFALKDNISAKGIRMTCASRMLEQYIPPFDATVTERLRAAGAVLVGKTNMDEFAMGSSTAYSALGVTRNPWDSSRVPGGSSGGSAAAVAAREVPFSLGTDTGGSVRQPAAFCGVYGLRPTYGAISRYGFAAMASSFDSIGILANTAADTAVIFSAIAGKDARDATSLTDMPFDPAVLMQTPLGHVRVGVVADFFDTRVSDEVRGALQNAIALLQVCGATVEMVHLPLPELSLATYSVLTCAEISSNMARYDGVRFGSGAACADSLSAMYGERRGAGLGIEVKRRVLFGTDMLREENRERYYVRAQRARELISRKMTELLENCDLLLTPTAPTVAFEACEQPDQQAMYYADLCTVYAGLSGLPALSIPFGFTESGLPLAIQLTARSRAEGLLLRAARQLEEVRS